MERRFSSGASFQQGWVCALQIGFSLFWFFFWVIKNKVSIDLKELTTTRKLINNDIGTKCQHRSRTLFAVFFSDLFVTFLRSKNVLLIEIFKKKINNKSFERKKLTINSIGHWIRFSFGSKSRANTLKTSLWYRTQSKRNTVQSFIKYFTVKPAAN